MISTRSDSLWTTDAAIASNPAWSQAAKRARLMQSELPSHSSCLFRFASLISAHAAQVIASGGVLPGHTAASSSMANYGQGKISRYFQIRIKDIIRSRRPDYSASQLLSPSDQIVVPIANKS